VIHLDTSFLIRALVQGSPQDRIVRQWLRAGEEIGISAIGWAEFLCGPIQARHLPLARLIVRQLFPFIDRDCATAAQLFNESGRRRGSLADCMIAATAIRYKASLATVNPQDFERFESGGVRIIVA
jgi:predicted nucleic acid-binding protein